jgi:ureidoacrylate peracid hydrolase
VNLTLVSSMLQKAYCERAIEPKRTALLSTTCKTEYSRNFWRRREAGLGNATCSISMKQLRTSHSQPAETAGRRQGRHRGIYTTIESLTKDGRDRSLDHKISRLHFPKGSHEAKIISAVGPVGDEIHIPKTSSGIFNSTNIEYVLRNLGIEYLVIYGIMTDQCVECAIRDAADRGFLVTQIEDACTAEDPKRHATSLEAMRGHYCRTRTTAQMIDEIASLAK